MSDVRTSKERLRTLRKTVEHYARSQRGHASGETLKELTEAAAVLQALEDGASGETCEQPPPNRNHDKDCPCYECANQQMCRICGRTGGLHREGCTLKAVETPERREYHANGTYWSGVPTLDMPCDFCGLAITEHDPRTHACRSLKASEPRLPMTGAYAPYATCKHGVHPYSCREGCDPHIMETSEPQQETTTEGDYPGKGHPWADFLHHRARTIDWLYSGEGNPVCRENEIHIAMTLSMTATQVFMIRTRNRDIPV